MTDTICTERLVLRRARADDLMAIHAVLSDASAMRYWSTPPHTDLDQTRNWLSNMIDASPDISDDYVIEYKGVVIGKAGCYRIPDIGYILYPDHWGRGLAREAVGAVCATVLRRPDVDRLTADVDPRNTGSIALLQRLGFVETGRAAATWVVGGEVCDSLYFTLTRDVSETV